MEGVQSSGKLWLCNNQRFHVWSDNRIRFKLARADDPSLRTIESSLWLSLRLHRVLHHIGAFVSGQLSKGNVGHTTPLVAGLTIACCATVLNILIAHSSFAGPFTLLPALMLFAFCYGLVAPNSGHGCMHPMPKIAGVATDVLTFSQMIVGALSSALVAVFYDGHSAWAMTAVMATFAFATAATLIFRVSPAENKNMT